jgi:phage shock protein PspC (stress-responsive transcriptional regulator)
MYLLGVCHKLSSKICIDVSIVQFLFIIGLVMSGGTAISCLCISSLFNGLIIC